MWNCRASFEVLRPASKTTTRRARREVLEPSRNSSLAAFFGGRIANGVCVVFSSFFRIPLLVLFSFFAGNQKDAHHFGGSQPEKEHTQLSRSWLSFSPRNGSQTARRSQTVEVSRLVGGCEPLVLEGELETPEHHQSTNSNQGIGCYGEAHLKFIKSSWGWEPLFITVLFASTTVACYFGCGSVWAPKNLHKRMVYVSVFIKGTLGVGFKGTLKGKPLCLGRSRKRRHTYLPAGSS